MQWPPERFDRAWLLALLCVAFLSPRALAQCLSTTTVNAAGGGDYTSLQAAVNALPSSAWSAPQCIQVEPGTYNESIDIPVLSQQNGYVLSIAADPAFPNSPVTFSASDSGGALFNVSAASVSLSGLTLQPNGSVENVLFLNGDFFSLSAMTLLDAGGDSSGPLAIINASSGSVSASTFTAAADGLVLQDASGNTLSGDSVSVAQGVALEVTADASGSVPNAADYNVISGGVFYAAAGIGVAVLSTGGSLSGNSLSLDQATSAGPDTSCYLPGFFLNCAAGVYLEDDYQTTVQQSTLAYTGATGSHQFGYAALYLLASASDTVSANAITTSTETASALSLNSANANSLLGNSITASGAGILISESDGNRVSSNQVVMYSSAAPYAVGLFLYDSSSNTMASDVVTGLPGSVVALDMESDGSSPCMDNAVEGGAYTVSGSGALALLFGRAVSDTVSGGVFTNTSGPAGALVTSLGYGGSPSADALQGVSITGASAALPALLLQGASSMVLEQDSIANASGIALAFDSGSSLNSVSQSTITSNAPPGSGAPYLAALWQGGSQNVVASSLISDPAGVAAFLSGGDTIASEGGLYAPSSAAAAGDSIASCQVNGSTGVWISSGARGTQIDSSTLAGTVLGLAIFSSSGLVVAGSSFAGQSGGTDLVIGAGVGGTLLLQTDAFSGASTGLKLSTPAAGAALGASALTFQGLAPGATDIYFLGGPWISTFSAAAFDDTNLGFNVDAARLSAPSRITLSAATGPEAGPGFDKDPNGVLSWTSLQGGPPGAPSVAAVFLDSVTVDWTPVGAADGYEVDASTAADFSGLLASSLTAVGSAASLTVAGLTDNTTYYFRAASLWPGATDYASVVPASTATLAAAPGGTTFIFVFADSATLSWTQTNPAGTLYSVSYWESAGSTTTLPLSPQTSVTLTGLATATTYYAQVRAVNWDGVFGAPGAVASTPDRAAYTYVQCFSTTTVNAGGGGDFLDLQSAINNLSSSSWNTAQCIQVEPGTYSETISISGFPQDGYRLLISADPAAVSLSSPVVLSGQNPGGSLFTLAEDSVTLAGLTLQPTGTSTSGLLVSGRDDSVVGSTVSVGGGASAVVLDVDAGTLMSSDTIVQTGYGDALDLENDAYDQILGTTLRASQGNAVYLLDSSSNTLTGDYLYSGGNYALSLYAALGIWGNTVSSCTLEADGYGGALEISGGSPPSYDTFTNDAFLADNGGITVELDEDYQTVIERATLTQDGTSGSALSTGGGAASDLFIGLSIACMNGSYSNAACVYLNSNGNLLSLSTVTASGSSQQSYQSVWIDGAFGNTLSSDFIAALTTAVWISGGTGLNSISSSTLQGVSAGLWVSQSSGFGLSASTVSAQAGGMAVFLDAGDGGGLSLSSSVFTGASQGLVLSTPAAGASLAADALSFSALASGSTAIEFTGGVWVATFAAASFDPSVGVNVNAKALGSGSAITMEDAAGAKAGPAFDVDPYHYVYWPVLAGGPPQSPVISAVSASAVSVTWTPVGASGGYELDAALTTNFSSYISSITANASASTLTVTGLAVNTTYYLRAGSIFAGATEYALTTPISTATLAVAPSTGAFTAVFLTSAALQWTSSDPGGTKYLVSFWSAGGSTATILASATNAELTGLGVAATYFAEVQAINRDGVLSAPDSVISTVTAPGVPAAQPAITAVFQSSLTVNWSLVGAPGYEVDVSSNASFSDTRISSASANASTSHVTVPGLTPDTTYYARVDSLWGNATNYVLSAPEATLAVAPTNVSFTAVTSNSAVLTWTATDGPLAVYDVFYSTPGGVASMVTALYPSSATLTGLNPDTAYVAHVSAVNWAGLMSAASVAASTTTLPAALTGLAGAALGVSSISWTWNVSPGASGYSIYTASNSALLVSVASPSFVETGLSTNIANGITVAALNVSGQGPLSAAATVYTLAAPPQGLALVSASTTSIVVSWQAGTDPAGTRFQASIWTQGASTTTLTTTATGATFSGLSGQGPYLLSIRAENGDGFLSGIVALSTRVPEALVADCGDNVPASGGPVACALTNGEVTLQIPPGALAESVVLTITAESVFPSAASAQERLTGTGVGIQLALDPELEPSLPVPLCIGYGGTALASSLDQSELQIARYDVVSGLWVPLVSSVDKEQMEVCAITDHFSLFQLMIAAPATVLSAPRIFPNPLRPLLGDTVVTFANFPAGTDLKIFDILGEKVRELSADASGTATWDGKNSNGQSLATGVYFVLAGSGGSRKTMKVGIVR